MSILKNYGKDESMKSLKEKLRDAYAKEHIGVDDDYLEYIIQDKKRLRMFKELGYLDETDI